MDGLSTNRLTDDAQNFQSHHADSRKACGFLGETLALKFLMKKGYKFIVRNYCIRGGEIDLILKKNDIIVFVEVKTRRGIEFGHPAESISRRKRAKLLRTIYTYLASGNIHLPWRCDLVVIQFTLPRQAQICHYQNIFSD